jgi:hypothetical protein
VKRRTIAALAVLCAAGLGRVGAEVPLQDAPAWESRDTDYSTGGALGDIDGDGDLDLVVSNGNDMAPNRDCAYLNQGGLLDTLPQWQSDDYNWAGHCAIGDLNNDGYPDLVVANFGKQYPFTKQLDNIYLNSGSGLAGSPVWNLASSDSDNSFGCALGDVDGDGDLDVAMGCGESYTAYAQYSKVYLNQGGSVDTHATWTSWDAGYSFDVTWGDVDNDGDLDLVLPREFAPNQLYLNEGGSLGTLPRWLSADQAWSERVALGDVNNDGYLDLAVADNAQHGGTSKIKIYMNHSGMFELSPSWSSKGPFRRYYSCVAWGDVNGDGWLDLAAGGWWEPVVVFENHGGVLDTIPSWSWSPSPASNLVCEQVIWGDINGDGLHEVCDTLSGDGVRKLFYLRHRPVHAFVGVSVGDSSLGLPGYCFEPVSGWVSLKDPPPAGSGNVLLRYSYSTALDLLVTNWDPETGNFLFLNTSGTGVGEGDGRSVLRPECQLAVALAPNPFTSSLSIRIERGRALGAGELLALEVFNLAGQRVRTLYQGPSRSALADIAWDGRDDSRGRVAPGVYLVRLEGGGRSVCRRATLIR